MKNDELIDSVSMSEKKLMEQKLENKKKSVAIKQALNVRFKTLEEQTSKLAYVKKELQKIDYSLGGNISRMRDEIDQAGREEASATILFDRLEKEYSEAKKRMEKAKSRKALLIEHLDYIILSNEKHKSSKLAELESELGLIIAPEPEPEKSKPPSPKKVFKGFPDDVLE